MEVKRKLNDNSSRAYSKTLAIKVEMRLYL